MLTISKLNSSSKATRYLCQDNYYTKDDGVEHSVWLGKGAERLELSGQIQPQAFEALLDGRVKGQQLGNVKKGLIRHRAGWDLTLSAPKSVSILSEVYKDEPVKRAHVTAVKSAMTFVEEHLIEARVFKQGSVLPHQTGNAVIASFTHDVSRALDPQLHTHNIIINATEMADRWRSVSPEKLYDEQKDIGRVYRSVLARELKQLGYTLRYNKSDHTLFEIEGFPEKLLKEFSQRASQIEDYFKDKGIEYDTTLAKQIALKTRTKKKNIDRKTLLMLWKERLVENKFSLSQIKRHTPEKITTLSASLAVSRSIRHLSEREMSFNIGDLKKEAYRLSIGNVAYSEIYKEIQAQVKKGNLIAWGDGKTNLWTTRENRAIEETLINNIEQNRQVLPARISPKTLHRVLKKQKLNEQQYTAVVAALTSDDRFFAIQGDAGVGKTHTLKTLKDLAIKQGDYDVLALASTHQAVGELTNSLKIDGVTVDHYLHNPALQNDQQQRQNNLWIIDETSMLSTQKINEIMHLAKTQNAKVIFVGDHNQLESVGAGRGFYQLLENGVDSVSITKRMRQQDITLDRVVDNILKKNFSGALNALKNSGHVIENEEAGAISTLVEHWFSLPLSEREKTTIVAPSNDQHHAINEQIRLHKMVNGELSKTDFAFKSYQDKYLTQTEKALASSYQTGEIVRFTQTAAKTLRQNNVESGIYYEVIGVNTDTNVVALRDKTHRKTVYLDPSDQRLSANGFSVYQSHGITLSVGDKLRYMDTDRELALRRNEPLTVEYVGSDKVHVRRENGQHVVVPITATRRGLHVKYNYAKTSYGVQGVTTKNVLALMQSWRKNTTNEKAFMVAVTRATHGVKIFTDNTEKLVNSLSQRSGENTQALDRHEQQEIKHAYQKTREVKKTGRTVA